MQNQTFGEHRIAVPSRPGFGISPARIPLAEICEAFDRELDRAGLHFGRDHDDFICSFVSALATKPFVIFSGLSGAGKTRLATAFGQWLGREHLLLQPVRPDWVSPSAVLGAPNLSSESSDNRHVWDVPRVLEFVLEAARTPDEPFLLVLEEMNLAHVEQYFADILSGIESGYPVVPNLVNTGDGWRLPVHEQQYLPWPKNVFLVGTINVDETTYTFSPKVLDRASVIEFRVTPSDLRSEYASIGSVQRGDPSIVNALLATAVNEEEPEWQGRKQIVFAMQQLHRLLYEHDMEFGHRVFRDALRFGAMLHDTGIDDPRMILDQIMLCRILPKLDHEGTRDLELVQLLAGFALYGGGKGERIDPLEVHDTSPVLPNSYAKLRRIVRRMQCVQNR